VRISPGRLTALWVVLRALHGLGDHGELEELRRHAARTSLRSGGLPIRDGLTLAIAGTFAVRSGDTLTLSPLGREALALGEEDEPNNAARRLFLSVLLLREPPPWVAFWQGQPGSLQLVLPEPERHLLADVGLYPEEDSDIENVAWWDALRRVPLPEEAGAYRKLVGDAGEELTVAYERARLQALGRPELAARVRWVARESPAYGFDVLSYTGQRPNRPLAIEVKSTVRPAPKQFSFFITAYEWSTAKRLADDYVFHFWDGVDPGSPPRSPAVSPWLVPSTVLSEHLPRSPLCGTDCHWHSAAVEIAVAGLDRASPPTPLVV
jgi:hypothetical protein